MDEPGTGPTEGRNVPKCRWRRPPVCTSVIAQPTPGVARPVLEPNATRSCQRRPKIDPWHRLNVDPRAGSVVTLRRRWVPPEVAVFESVAVAFEGDDFGVVDEPVDHGGGDGGVTEDFAPAAEGFVAGDDERGSFVAGGDELEEQVGGVGFEGDVADLVDDSSG